MGGRHRSTKGKRSSWRGRGRHRARNHRLEPYAWLGAGAITLGLGAAIASGSGVAHAEEGPASGGSPSAGSPSAPDKPAETGTANGPTAAITSTVTPTKDPAGTDQGTPATTHDKPVVSIAASGSTTITFAGTTKIAAKDADPEDEPTLDLKSKPEADPNLAIQSVVAAATPAPTSLIAEHAPTELALEEKDSAQAVDPALTLLALETAPTASLAMASVASTASMANPGPLSIAADISVGKGSGPSALSPDGGYLYVVNTSSNTVSVVNTRTNAVVSTPIPQYAISAVVAGDAGRYVYVSHQFGTAVTVVDTKNNNAVSGLDMGEVAPRLWASPDGKLVYVGVATGIAVIDTATNTLTSTRFIVDHGTWDIAFNADGSRLYVVSRTGGTSSPTGGVPNGSVAEFDTFTGSQVGNSISVGFTPVSLAVSPNGRYVYVANNLPADYVPTGINDPRPPGTVSVIDLQAPTPGVVATVPVGYGPVNLIVSPDGHRVYVVNSFNTGDLSTGIPSGGTISVIDADHNTVVGSPLPIGLPLFGIFSGGIKGIAISNDSRRLYVVNLVDGPLASPTGGLPTSSLLAFDTSSAGTPTLLGSIPVGYQPASLALSPDGTHVYVVSLMPRIFNPASFPSDGSLPNGSVTVVNTAASNPPPPPPVRNPLPVKKNNKPPPQAPSTAKPAPAKVALSAPAKAPSAPVKKKPDFGAAVNNAIIAVAKALDQLNRLSDREWAEALKVSPEQAKLLRQGISLVSTALNLLQGSIDLSTHKHPVTGPLKYVAGIAGGVALGLPVLPPQVIPVKAAAGGLALALGGLNIVLSVVDPDL